MNSSIQKFIFGVLLSTGIIGLLLGGLVLGNSLRLDESLTEHMLFYPALICLGISGFAFFLFQSKQEN